MICFLLERQTIGTFRHNEYTDDTIQSNGIFISYQVNRGRARKGICSGIIMLFVFCVQIIQGTNHEQMFASHEPTTSDILLDKKVAQA